MRLFWVEKQNQSLVAIQAQAEQALRRALNSRPTDLMWLAMDQFMAYQRFYLGIQCQPQLRETNNCYMFSNENEQLARFLLRGRINLSKKIRSIFMQNYDPQSVSWQNYVQVLIHCNQSNRSCCCDSITMMFVMLCLIPGKRCYFFHVMGLAAQAIRPFRRLSIPSRAIPSTLNQPVIF